jgi:hypothetical protein
MARHIAPDTTNQNKEMALGVLCFHDTAVHRRPSDDFMTSMPVIVVPAKLVATARCDTSEQ